VKLVPDSNALCGHTHLNSRASSPPYFGRGIHDRDRNNNRLPFRDPIRSGPVSSAWIRINDIDVHIYSLNLVVEDSIAAHERLGEWYDVGLSGHSEGGVQGRVQPEPFADDGVEVLEGVEVVHRRRVVRERPEFFAQFGLDFRVTGETEERPCGRRRDRFVALKRIWLRVRNGQYTFFARSGAMLTLTCNQERRNLVEGLLNGELLPRREAFVHV